MRPSKDKRNSHNRSGRDPLRGRGGLSSRMNRRGGDAHLDESLQDRQEREKAMGPLDFAVQKKMENSFDADFSSVNIHKDSTKAKNLGAQALTQGENVHFAPGQFNPQSNEGQKLIGHEFAHVVQQREGQVTPTTQAKGVAINNDKQLEAEADSKGAKAAAGEHIGQTHTGSTADVTSQKVVQRQTGQEALDQIAPQQAIYEFAAHWLVYKAEGYQLQDNEKSVLTENGYSTEVIWFGRASGARLGFQAVLIPSLSANLDPILALRGTVPGPGSESLMTIYTDLDAQAVGYKQFTDNQELIAEILSEVGRPVDVTGHSLGGAMAQHIAANFPGQVANVATFQAPGIDQASVDRFNAIPENERPGVTHHIVTGDIVDKAGEANLPGDVYEHDFGGELHAQTLLDTLGGQIDAIHSDLRSFRETTHEINMLMLELALPGGNDFEDLEHIAAKSQELRTIYERIGSNIGEIRTYVGEVAGTILTAHLSHVFSSSHYEGLREQIGTDRVLEGKTSLNRESTVERFDTYPHADQRAIAEPIRQNAGGRIQGILRAWIEITKVFESVIAGLRETWNQAREMVVGTAEGIRDGVVSGYNQSREQLQQSWNDIQNITTEKLERAQERIERAHNWLRNLVK